MTSSVTSMRGGFPTRREAPESLDDPKRWQRVRLKHQSPGPLHYGRAGFLKLDLEDWAQPLGDFELSKGILKWE